VRIVESESESKEHDDPKDRNYSPSSSDSSKMNSQLDSNMNAVGMSATEIPPERACDSAILKEGNTNVVFPVL